MSLGDWFKRLFSSSAGEAAEDEAAEREDYGAPDEGEAVLEQPTHTQAIGGIPSLAGTEGAEAAENDLKSFEPPADPAP